MPLTDVKIKNAKPAFKAYKLYDERGLFLIVTPKGGKWWRFKYRFDDKEKLLSLGVYLSLSNTGTVTMTAIPTAALPSCPANNRITCMKNPYDASCIRLVRARICDPAVTASCNRVQYQTLFSFVSLPLDLPTATAIVPAETLGAAAGAVPCP